MQNDEDIPGLGELFEMGFMKPILGTPGAYDIIQQPGVPIGVMPAGSPFKLKSERKARQEAARKANLPPPAGRGTEGVASPLPLSHGRISQRFPTAVSRTEDPLTENLLINMNVLKNDPNALQRASDLIASYPGTTKQMLEMNPTERVDALRDQMTENLLHLYDLMPPEARQRASQWYHGANRISGERAAETGVHPHAAAGTYAALSPQMDWFKNVYFGDQVLRTLAHDPMFDASMLRMAQEAPTLKRYRQEDIAQLLPSLQGRRLSDMTPSEQAIALRLHDETHGPRQYSIITPEGDYGNLVTTQTGAPARPGWGSFTDIEKAIRAATETGGNASLISPLMGEKHKVRNFYNDIVAPVEAEKFGDITGDTHQIAGGLFRPLSGQSIEVAQGLGSGGGALGSSRSGLQGLYPIIADATRNAAAQRGVPVIEMQSVPWEGIRSLFPANFKTASNQAVIDDIWRSYGRGEITANEARERVVRAAGGFIPPTW